MKHYKYAKYIYPTLGVAAIALLLAGMVFHYRQQVVCITENGSVLEAQRGYCSNEIGQDAYLHSRESYASLFFTELGMAFGIALFLVGSIEILTQEKHKLERQEIKEDVLHAVYGHRAPHELFPQIKKIFNSEILRRKLTITYKLLRPYDKDDVHSYIGCINTVDYYLENLTDKPVIPTIAYSLSRPVNPKWDNEMYCYFEHLIIDGTTIPKNLLDENSIYRQEDDGTHRILSYSEKLIPPMGKIHVNISAQFATRPTDMNNISSTFPSDGVRVEVDISQQMATVRVDANHPEEIKKVGSGQPAILCWELKDSILPGQSINIAWYTPKAV